MNIILMNKILVSACLLGETVRYDGKSNYLDNHCLTQWQQQDMLISFCPEVSAGLPIPRIAAEINHGDGYAVIQGTATVIDKKGNDLTAEFITGAKLALETCKTFDIKIAILAQRSPSCGNHTIYDGTFNRVTISGSGVTTALLQKNGIRVFNQTELDKVAQFISE